LRNKPKNKEKKKNKAKKKKEKSPANEWGKQRQLKCTQNAKAIDNNKF
jgi:hypothetical protein